MEGPQTGFGFRPKALKAVFTTNHLAPLCVNPGPPVDSILYLLTKKNIHQPKRTCMGALA